MCTFVKTKFLLQMYFSINEAKKIRFLNSSFFLPVRARENTENLPWIFR